jgi:sialate O-acetylesterase
MLPGPPTFVRAPTSQYNNFVHQYMPAAVRGVIIELREHDVDEPHYEARLTALIKGLRDVMHRKDTPFCVMQMHCPHHYERKDEVEQQKWMSVRQAQTNVMRKLPGVTTVATYDHDPKHRESTANMLGVRAAQWALAVIGDEQVKTGPTLKSVRPSGDSVVITFENTGDGLMAGLREPHNPDVKPLSSRTVAGFEVADAAGAWHEANATLTAPDTVTVTCKDVASPAAVRYAWAVCPLTANLYNKTGFPALPFERPTN